MSSKAMEWICHILKEVSKDQKDVVRVMENERIEYIVTYYFYMRKFNAHCRYMSIISLKGDQRLFLIIQEKALNAGWLDVAFKVERFFLSTY